MSAYYNEIDPYAAAWLRRLIAGGHIADGIVDERSIEDIHPAELREFTQCHFFAGIGVWSRALRLAHWPDERRVWTGSCPCQPFSAAGKGAGFADERHLWPAFHHLIAECRPPVVFGEQVASKDGLQWLDLVRADLEGSGYAIGAADLCAAGVGAPHIRQRLWWVGVADDNGNGRSGLGQARLYERREGEGRKEPAPRDPDGSLWDHAPGRSTSCGLDNNNNTGLEGLGSGHCAEGGREGAVRPVTEAGESGGVADTEHLGYRGQATASAQQGSDEPKVGVLDGRHSSPQKQPAASPTHGHWGDADWLFCRDGKWRPVEPGTFPLVDGAPARVGRLRAYGNAIVCQVAQTFIEAYLDIRG